MRRSNAALIVFIIAYLSGDYKYFFAKVIAADMYLAGTVRDNGSDSAFG